MITGTKEIPLLTTAKPEFAREREWTKTEGQKMRARLVAVKEGQCLFERAGKQFPYAIDQLSAEDQKMVEQFQSQTRRIPLP